MRVIYKFLMLMMTPIHSEKGFTLLEIVIVIAIMALGYGVFILFGFGAKGLMRQEASNLSQRIRYVYQLAATESQYYRIVFDFDENQYFVEVSEDPIFVKTETEEGKEKKEEKNEDDEDGYDAADVADFAEAEDEQLEIYKIDADLKIYSVYVEHQKDKILAGKAYLNFFPRGQTEFAVIQISNQDESEFMTLQVNPTTGSITIYDELKDHDVILEELKEQ